MTTTTTMAKTSIKVEVNLRCFKIQSLLFLVVQSVKCWWIFLRLNTKGWTKLQKREGNRFPVFTSSTKRKNWVISGRGRARTEKKRTKKGDARTKVLFAYLLLFYHFSCRRRPQRCLSSLYLVLADISKTPLDLDCLTRNACCLQNSTECQVSFRYSWK